MFRPLFLSGSLLVAATAMAEPATVLVQGDREVRRDSTGSKMDIPILESPQSVSVISQDWLEEQNVQSLSQALGYVAGVSVNATGTDTRYDWPFIRGFSSTTYGLYLDGLRWQPNQLSGRFDTYGLEQIEVLKGPASVLYGQGTPGGLIDMVSKTPTENAAREVQLDYGSFDRKQIKADVGGGIDSGGRWLYRVVALARDADTPVDFTTDQREFVSPALTWRPNSDTSLTLLGNFQRDLLGSFYPFLPAIGTVLPNPNGRVSTHFFSGDTDFNSYSRAQYSLGYRLDTRLNSVWSVSQSLRYNRFKVNEWDQMYGVRLEADQRTLDRSPFTSRGSSDLFSADTRAVAHWSTGIIRHTTLMGVDYGWSRLLATQVSNFTQLVPIDVFDPVYGQTVPPLTPSTNTEQRPHQLGLYAQEQAKIAERWVLLVGTRHDWASAVTDNRLTKATTHQSDSKLSTRAGIVYLSKWGLAPYFSYSESFLPTAGTDFFGQPLKPSTGKQTEGGVRYQPDKAGPFGIQTSITVAVFDIRQRNVQETDPVHPGFAVQTGEIRSHGGELEASARLQGFELRGTYTTDQVRTTESNNPAAIGQRPTTVPERMASIWAGYTFTDGIVQGLGFGAGARYVGDTFGGNYLTSLGASRPIVVPSFTLMDALLHYDWRALRFAVNANNVLNRVYVAACYSATGCSYGEPRNVIANVSYHW